MEQIFKIKARSSVNPRDLYPSERRYSARIVLGFSIFFIFYFICSILMGALIIYKIQLYDELAQDKCLRNVANTNEFEEPRPEFKEKVRNDLPSSYLDEGYDNIHFNINVPALVSVGCFVMALGYLVSTVTGILAWNRWYIDRNITFFFIATCFSVVTSSISLLLSILNTYNISHSACYTPVGRNLNLFILFLSIAGWTCSVIATRLAFKGTNNTYPEDMGQNDKFAVSTISRRDKTIISPDVVNSFLKNFPKNDFGGTLKRETHDHKLGFEQTLQTIEEIKEVPKDSKSGT